MTCNLVAFVALFPKVSSKGLWFIKTLIKSQSGGLPVCQQFTVEWGHICNYMQSIYDMGMSKINWKKITNLCCLWTQKLTLKGNYWQTFASLSTSDCSQSQLDCNCLETGCPPSRNLYNHLAFESGCPEVEGLTCFTYGGAPQLIKLKFMRNVDCLFI